MKPKAPKQIWIPRWHGSETGLAEDVWYDTPIQNSVEYLRADAVKRKPLPKELIKAAKWLIYLLKLRGREKTQGRVVRELLRRARVRVRVREINDE